MEHTIIPFFEFLGLALGGLVIASKTIPELRRFTIALQIGLFFYGILRQYLKYNSNKLPQAKHLMLDMTSHYFNTHPDGKKIAEKTEMDEKTHEKARLLFLEELQKLEHKLTGSNL